MPSKFVEQMKKGWNAFLGGDPTHPPDYLGPSYYARPDRHRMTIGNERTIITAIYDRFATDVSSITVKHVMVDLNGRYKETVRDSLNECLTLSANKDQIARHFFKDLCMSMFDDGCVAVVPTQTSANITLTDSFDIYSMRVGKIVEWYPNAVKVELYNELNGRKEQIQFPKSSIAIIENPFYAIMNEPNSIVRRINRKLVIMDDIDEQQGSGKLDLIIQLPYTVKSPAKKLQARERVKDIEMQLSQNKYGIAYVDATERITQINRAVENHVLDNVQYLTNQLYSQLGISENILKGTADEKEMLNYQNNVIYPIISTITEEMKRKFLTKTARSQGHDIMYFKEPFSLVPVDKIADIADKFTRNAILSSNELRAIVGFQPVDDPQADELRNKNLNQEADGPEAPKVSEDSAEDTETRPDTGSSSEDGSEGTYTEEEVKMLLRKILKGVQNGSKV